MSIASINYGTSVLGQSVKNINQQLTNLSTQLSTGVKSTNYAGMGANEGFAVAARSQLANISAFGDTMTNVTTIINAANAALQSLSSTVSEVQSEANASPQNLTGTGQTIGQQNAASQFSAMVGMLNTQVGDRYIFSGNAISTQPVAPADDIMNGTGTQAGLKQVIAERLQADQGSASPSTGRLVQTQPTANSIQVAEDFAGSPFGIKLGSVSSTNASGSLPANIAVTGPTGSPAAITVSMPTNPSPGDQVTFNFNLPDGTSQSVKLTATTTTPPPSGSFAIDSTSAANTTSNLNAALNTAISNIANTSLVAASAVAAGNNFFNTTTAIGSAQNNKLAAPITGATALSGAGGTDSLASNFNAGDTITVNGQAITFVASGASGNNQINVTDNVQTLLSKIDALSGTSTPSTVNGGVITLNGNSGAPSLSVTSSNTAAFAALGFPGGAATPAPLRVSGSPLSSATSLASGAANTVEWYTGNSGPGTARSSATVLVDNSQSVQFGAQANEQAIRNSLQQIAVYAAVVLNPPAGPNAGAQASALSQRVGANLTPQPGQQAISDIQTQFATAQTTIKDVQARQTQSKAALQNLISSTEGISPDQVASQILALQTSLQASYQTTSMLSQLSLVKYLPAG